MFCNFHFFYICIKWEENQWTHTFMVQGKMQIKKINLPVELVVFIDVTVVADCGVCVNDTLKKNRIFLNQRN